MRAEGGGRLDPPSPPIVWLREFFATLEYENLTYVGLRVDESLFEPDSEIDLLVHPRSLYGVLAALRGVCRRNPHLRVVQWREMPRHASSVVLAWEEAYGEWRYVFFDIRTGIRKKGQLLFDATMLSAERTLYDENLGMRRLRDHYERALLILRNTVDMRPYSERHLRILSERSEGKLSDALKDLGWETLSEGVPPQLVRKPGWVSLSRGFLAGRYALRALYGRLALRVVPLEVAIYGPDGVGKSTQARLVGELLREAGVRRVHLFHSLVEVQRYAAIGPPRRSSLRSVAYRRTRSRLAMRLIVTLSFLKRRVRATLLTRPLLRRGDAVIHDRYLFDVMADFEKNRGVRFPKLEAFLCRLSPPRPYVVLLQAPAETVSARTGELSPAQVSDTYRLLEACLEHAGSRVRGWKRIDASAPEAAVARSIVAHVLREQTALVLARDTGRAANR